MKRFLASILLCFLLFSNLGVFFQSVGAEEGSQDVGEQSETFPLEENNLPQNETQSLSEQYIPLPAPEINEEVIENTDEESNLENSQTEAGEQNEFLETSESSQEIQQESSTGEDQKQFEVSEIQQETSGEDAIPLESENSETGQEESGNNLPGETEELPQEENLENSQVIEEVSLLFVPYISISFQQPSYLIREEENSQLQEVKSESNAEIIEIINSCDELHAECKANFDFRASFTSEFPEKDFICESDFGLPELTGQENKCNPNTILYPEGKSEGFIRIIRKDDRTKYRELKIIVKNRFSEPGDIGEQDPQDSQEESDGPGNPGGQDVQEKLEENQDESENENTNFGEAISGTGGQIENENSSEASGAHTGSEEDIVLPEILYEFQNWTYLIASETDNSFICDRSKEFCRANYNFEASFAGAFQQKDFICQIDFGLGELTGEEEKCNPAGIMYPEGNFETKVRIILKNNPELFTEKIISVQNISKIVSIENEDQTITQSGSLLTATGSLQEEIENGLGVKNLEILYDLQRPSYAIISPEKDDIFSCDRTKPECKINFDFEKSFSDDFSKNDYSCKLDFGFGVLTGEEEKCNPNTVVFPVGEYKMSIIISQKNNPEIFSEKILFIKNEGYQAPQKASSTSLSPQNISSIKHSINISLYHGSIIVQSGLEKIDDGTGMFYRCLKKECKINLNYEKKHSAERCLWDFGVGIQSNSETHTHCNPGYVTFSEGDHRLSLTVYENKNDNNRKKLIFYVNNLWEDETLEQQEENELGDQYDIENIGENEESVKNIGTVNIILQGKISKEKTYQQGEQLLRCEGVEKCFVNLIGKVEIHEKNLRYIWKIDGEVFSEILNPKGIWVEKGDHEIIFEIYQDSILLGGARFQVNVYPKITLANLSQEVGEGEKNIFFSQKSRDEPQLFSGYFYEGMVIHDFLVDPLGSDIKEYIELKNTSSESRNLEGCYLQTTNSKKYFFESGSYMTAGEVRRFLRPLTKLTLGNNAGKISLFCNNTLQDEKIWTSKVREGVSYLGTFVGVYTSEYLRSELSPEEYEIYVKNAFQFSARSLKYDGLKLSGETLPGSRVEGYIGEKKLYDIIVGNNGKYEYITKNIAPGKHKIIHFVTDIYGNRYEMKARSFTLKPESGAYWFRPRPKRAQKVTKSPQLIIEKNTSSKELQDLVNLGYTERGKIFLLYTMIIAFSLFAFFHIFFILFSKDARPDIITYQTRTRFQFVMILGEQKLS